ncbi:MAG: nuclear transport factor 2 family protein [Flavobacteriaceae bacterium]|nr:nuclear transport factor 2 family protein [Flavobacteriaceae bacterium]
MKLKAIVICLVVLVFCRQSTFSQETKEDEIKEVISLFFKGLQSGDTLTIKKTISNDLLMQTAYTNKEGKSMLRTENVSKFLNAVASKKREDIWEEKLLSYHIQIDGNMANVWTPYKFYFNNDFSHCGVNSFQLFFDGKKWKIIYLIDTRRKQSCKK